MKSSVNKSNIVLEIGFESHQGLEETSNRFGSVKSNNRKLRFARNNMQASSLDSLVEESFGEENENGVMLYRGPEIEVQSIGKEYN